MRHLIAIALAALSACSTTPVSSRDGMYYLDGIDRSDGMSASLSEKDGHLRIAGDRFTLASCLSNSLTICFTSDYLAFSYPANDAELWQAAGYEFTKAGSVISQDGQIEVIRSVQRYGTFYFYFSRRSGLIGWDLSYETAAGATATDRYRRQNLGQIRRPQSNNSFKPKPLRGSA